MKINLCILVFFVLTINTSGFSQVSIKNQPYSFLMAGVGMTINDKSQTSHLLDIDNQKEQLAASALQTGCNNCTEYYGKVINIKINIKKDGTAHRVPGGTIWFVNLESSSALGLQFYFDHFKLPSTASLFIYNDDHSVVLGAFTHINNHSSGKFATRIVRGNKITIEYFEADENEFSGELSIEKIAHVFKDASSPANPVDGKTDYTALPCTIDINCAAGSSLKQTKKSVCRISKLNDDQTLTSFCSGFLVNSNNGVVRSAFVLSAQHCVAASNETDFAYWVFEFNYENTICGTSGPDDETVAHNGATLVTGGTVSDNIDYVLFDLGLSDITKVLDVVFMGWNLSNSIATGTANISHPNGDVKKVAISTSAPLPQIGSIGSNGALFTTDPDGINQPTVWEVNWTSGITMGVSSGSPLIVNNNQAIGLLLAGHSTCNWDNSGLVPGPDYFSQLGVIWNQYSPSLGSKPLGKYLDPTSSVTSLNSFVPSVTGNDPNSPGSQAYAVGRGYDNDNPTPTYVLGKFTGLAQKANICNANGWVVSFGGASIRGYNNGSWNTTNPSGGVGISLDSYGAVTSEVFKPFTFIKGNEYVLTLQTYADESQGGVKEFQVILRTDPSVPESDFGSNTACGVWYGADLDGTWQSQDQLIMDLDKTKMGSENYALRTYAVKFIPKSNYSFISLVNVGYIPILVDNINLFTKGQFRCTKCTDNYSYTTTSQVPVETDANVSISFAPPASGSIVIASGASTKAVAHTVYMEPGFHAAAGSSFDAQADDCIFSPTPHDVVGPLENYSASSRTDTQLPPPNILFNYEGRTNIYKTIVADQDSLTLVDEDILVYPNPAKARTTILFTSKNASVPYVIYDLSGKVILQATTATKLMDLDLSSFRDGVFFIRTNYPGKIRNKVSRLIVTK